ncbi:MAG: GNAT family N-acetyltransferase [Liquorilactobacillus sp.]|uniref:GNAT family N-acetyltransferase n=1 Tax=Liquorilactobacillus sp. TaxID=2767923 RepID=UPI0039E9F1A9
MLYIRTIQSNDDPELKQLVQKSLQTYHLDIPGTAYFDPELDHLSLYYGAKVRRQYFVATNEQQAVLGGTGIAEYDLQTQTAELQKLYLTPSAQGQHLSYQLLDAAIQFAKQARYHRVYLETHHNLKTAIHVYQKYGFLELSEPLKRGEYSAMDCFFAIDI